MCWEVPKMARFWENWKLNFKLTLVILHICDQRLSFDRNLAFLTSIWHPKAGHLQLQPRRRPVIFRFFPMNLVIVDRRYVGWKKSIVFWNTIYTLANHSKSCKEVQICIANLFYLLSFKEHGMLSISGVSGLAQIY